MKNRDFKRKIFIKEQIGITLIALVITIVVLLILAGVTVNTLFNDNGIINSASNSSNKYKMQVIKEQIETEKTNWEAERVSDDTKKIEDFFSALEKAGIINNVTEDISKPETTVDGENEISKYEITTKEGYIVEIIITKKSNEIAIVIGNIEESNNPLPKIEILEIQGTDNSITVKVKVSRIGNGKLTYLYKLHNVEQWTEAKKTTENELEITGLEKGKIYDVKVVAQNENGEKEAKKSIRTGKLETGTITASTPTWSNGTASITLSTTSNFDIQYQINSLSESGWKNYTSTGITEIENNATIYTRLTDGVNYGEEASISIKDEIIPKEANVVFSEQTVKINKEMTVTVTLKDNESGIDLSRSKWIFNQTSTAIGTSENSYDNTFTSITEILKMTPTSTGNWYLHILSTDKAGNVKETIKGTVKAEVFPEEYTWTQNKTIVIGTPKEGGNNITYEVGDDYKYDCGIASYKASWGYEWEVLGAENGKLLIVSSGFVGTLELLGKYGYTSGVRRLNAMCEPYGTNARSINVDDINRITGYDPNNPGDGKKYNLGEWGEYGSKVTYTASGSTATNGKTYTGSITYEHPDGRIIGTNDVTSITVTSTRYEYYPNTLTTSATGETKGIELASKAYQMILGPYRYGAYWLASSYMHASSSASWFGLFRISDNGSVYTESLGDTNNKNIRNVHLSVRAVVSL